MAKKKYKLVGTVGRMKRRGEDYYTINLRILDTIHSMDFSGVFENEAGEKLRAGDMIEVHGDLYPNGKVDNFRFKKIKK